MWKQIVAVLLVTLVAGIGSCSQGNDMTEPSQAVPVEDSPAASPLDSGAPLPIHTCRNLLVGLSVEVCNLDIHGPGNLTIEIRPDSEHSSWQLAINGLTALTQSCEFHGSFDRHNPSSLQGRGEATLICPIAASVDRQWHTLSFEGQLDIPNLTIIIFASYEN
jgi:hypothetical protein